MTTTLTPAALSASASANGRSGDALTQTAVDFDMFLKLLTTQMQNQDPLKPMESTEYTQQLAQFSQVEQTVKQTGALNDILAQLTTQSMAQASGFVGREAEFDTDVAGLSASGPARWRLNVPEGAAGLTAVVSDASGRKVATLSPDPAAGEIAWTGALADGRTAAPGSYTVAVTATDAAGGQVSVPVTSVGRVTEVLGGNGAVTLGVNGAQLPLGKLRRLGETG